MVAVGIKVSKRHELMRPWCQKTNYITCHRVQRRNHVHGGTQITYTYIYIHTHTYTRTHTHWYGEEKKETERNRMCFDTESPLRKSPNIKTHVNPS